MSEQESHQFVAVDENEVVHKAHALNQESPACAPTRDDGRSVSEQPDGYSRCQHPGCFGVHTSNMSINESANDA